MGSENNNRSDSSGGTTRASTFSMQDAIEVTKSGKEFLDKLAPLMGRVMSKSKTESSETSTQKETSNKKLVINGVDIGIIDTFNGNLIINITGDCESLNVNGVTNVVVTSSTVNTINANNIGEFVNNSKEIRNLNI